MKNNNYLEEVDAFEQKNAKDCFGDESVRNELKQKLQEMRFACIVYRQGYYERFFALFATIVFCPTVYYVIYVFAISGLLDGLMKGAICVISALVFLPIVLVLKKIISPTRRYCYFNESESFMYEKRSSRHWIYIQGKNIVEYKNGKCQKLSTYKGLIKNIDHLFSGIFCEKVFVKNEGSKTIYLNDFHKDVKKIKYTFSRVLGVILELTIGFLLEAASWIFLKESAGWSGLSKRSTGSGFTYYTIIYENNELKKVLFGDNRTKNFHRHYVMHFSDYNKEPNVNIPMILLKKLDTIIVCNFLQYLVKYGII